MSIDLNILEKHGATEEKLKALFEKEEAGRSESINELINLHKERTKDGIDQNLRDSRFWWAIDQAYDVAHRQVTYTQVRGLIDKNPDLEAVRSAAADWGLTHMLTKVKDKNGNIIGQKFDLPTFFNIFVPIVMAYTKIRWAKLFNDRDLYPLYKYEPLKLSLETRLKADMITDRIQRMSVDMGYRDDEKQSIFQMLLYGVCLNFPSEDYFREYQAKGDGKRITKEGVRFTIPHPSRVFYDLNHRPSTFNYDIGAEYAGYWEVVRYGDVDRNKDFWNRDKITWGKGDHWPWSGPYGLYSALFPCSVSFPNVHGATGGTGDLDRQDAAFRYTKNNYDSAVNLVPFFHKLVPKDWGLYDYEYPVWHRFVYAGQDTVIHCKPLAYSPVVAYLYDCDNNRARNASLGLELLPWQDHLGNLLTQYILSVKKNLTRVVLWNKSVCTQDQIDTIVNAGEKLYREALFIPFAPVEMQWNLTGPQQAFFPVSFSEVNTSEIVASINTVLGMCERVLGFSSQELGAAASHEQSAREVSIIEANNSVRMEFTGGFVDEAMWARKRLLYDAMMAYSSDEIFAQIAELNDVKEAALKKMGFEVEKSEDGASAGVTGPKANLELEGFSSNRDGKNRINDTKLATTMVQTFQSIFSNPDIVAAAGIEQLFELFNQILIYAGMPADFKLRFNKEQSEQFNAQKAQEMMVQIAQKVMEEGVKQMGEAMKTQLLDPMQQQDQEQTEAIKAVAERTQQGEQAIQAIAVKTQEQTQAIQALAAKSVETEQALAATIQKLQMLVAAATQPAPMPPPMMPPMQ